MWFCNPEHGLLKTKEIYTYQRDPPNVVALAHLGSVANLSTVHCVPFREGEVVEGSSLLVH
jgi:hypothetical protein